MAYKEVEEIYRIRQFDKKLRDNLNKRGQLYEERAIGYPSGHIVERVKFLNSGPGAIWHHSWTNQNGEVVNLFGRGEFGSNRTLLIDLQFNYSTTKIKKSLGGAFLEDSETDEISLAHRGIITVLNRIPKELAFEAMAGHAVDAQSSRKQVEFLLITDLNSQSLLRDIGEFASELRDSVRSKAEDAEFGSKSRDDLQEKTQRSGFDQLNDYFKEFTGERKSHKPRRLYPKSNHGKVVEALREEFSNNGKALKSRAIDLVVEQKKRALLFEVKTSSDTQSIYTAIGQLSVHVVPAKERLKKPIVQVLIVPEQPMKHIADVIANELKFRVATYSIDKQGNVSFHDLDLL